MTVEKYIELIKVRREKLLKQYNEIGNTISEINEILLELDPSCHKYEIGDIFECEIKSFGCTRVITSIEIIGNELVYICNEECDDADGNLVCNTGVHYSEKTLDDLLCNCNPKYSLIN